MKSQIVNINGAYTSRMGSLDWGMSLAKAHRRKVMAFAILPCFIQLIATYLLFSSRMTESTHLVIGVLTTLSSVWLLTSVCSYFIETLRGEVPSVTKILLGSLINLPKVFLSYGGAFLLITLGLVAYVVPGVVLIGYLLWAPACCVGELYSQKVLKKKEEDAEDEVFEREVDDEFRFFTDFTIIDLGFARSWRLAATQIRTSYKLVLLIIAAVVIPVALLDLVFQQTQGFIGPALKTIVREFFVAYVAAIWAGAFLHFIPSYAREEIKLPRDLSEFDLPESSKKGWLRLDSKPRRALILFFLVLFSFWVITYTQLRSMELPSGVLIEAQEAKIEKEELRLELRIADNQYGFRWLSPFQFRLTYGEDSFVTNDAEKPKELPVDVVFSPNRIDIFDETGKLLEPSSVSPYDGVLKLVLRFDSLPGMAEKGSFKLYYSPYISFSGVDTPVYSGQFGSNW